MSETPADNLNLALRYVPLPPGGVLVCVPVGTDLPDDLPPDIRKTAPRRQRTFAAGRAAGRRALQMAGFTGQAPMPPADDQLPEWPLGWHGSISHTDDIAAALVAPTGPQGALLLGLDIERIVSPEIAAEIAPGVMPEAPIGRSGLPAGEEVTRAFSAKEALYKALYPQTRAFRDFDAARVVWQGSGRNISLTLTEDWGPDFPDGMIFYLHQQVAAGHVVTILWR